MSKLIDASEEPEGFSVSVDGAIDDTCFVHEVMFGKRNLVFCLFSPDGDETELVIVIEFQDGWRPSYWNPPVFDTHQYVTTNSNECVAQFFRH